MKLPAKSKAYFWIILLFAFILPFSQFLSVRLLIVILFLPLFLKDTKISIRYFLAQAWVVLLYLVILFIGLLYTADMKSGFRVMETSFSLLALPIIFSALPRLEENDFFRILLSFIGGLVLASAICLAQAIITFYQSGLATSFLFYQFTDILSLQPTYFAYYLCFGISVLLYIIHYKKTNYPSGILIVTSLFLFTILMLTAGRTAYMAILLVFSFFILKFFFEEGNTRSATVTFSMSLTLLICMLMINYFNINSGTLQSADNNDYWERITLWQSALNANPDFLFGVGTGDVNMVLNKHFTSHNLTNYATANFNSHNQFINTFLSSGILGLISLLFLLGYPLFKSVKHQNVLGIMTFFSFFIYGITEVFLGRYQGVVFFAFLSQAFLAYYNTHSSNGSLKEV